MWGESPCRSEPRPAPCTQANQDVLAKLPLTTQTEFEAAVAAAKAAFPKWRATPVPTRARVMLKFQELIRANMVGGQRAAGRVRHTMMRHSRVPLACVAGDAGRNGPGSLAPGVEVCHARYAECRANAAHACADHACKQDTAPVRMPPLQQRAYCYGCHWSTP